MSCRTTAAASLTAAISVLFISALTPAADAQTVPGGAPALQPPAATGVVPMPTGPPPTGLQNPLPSPAAPPSDPMRPLLLSPPAGVVLAAVRSRPLTIQDAVAIALVVNRSFATASEALIRAQGRRAEARSALQPTVGATANIQEYDAPTTASFGASSFTILNQFNPILGARASLPIDIGGALRAAASQSQFQEIAARIDVNRVRNQLVFDVKTAFYNVLRARAQVIVATESLTNTLGRLSDVQKNFAVGTVPRFDVISVQRDVADAQHNVIRAQSQLRLSFSSLKNAMGVDITAPMQISDASAVETPPGTEAASLPSAPQGAPRSSISPDAPLAGAPVAAVVNEGPDLGPEYHALVSEAHRNRPEVLEAEASIEAARRGIAIAHRSALPVANISVGYIYTPESAGFTRVNQADVSLGLSVPIFEGGLARSRERQARADVAGAETARRAALDQVAMEVEAAYVALVQARDQVAVSNVGVAQASEAYRLALVRYRAGVSQQAGISPQLEVSNAQTALTVAESSRVNALYDYNNARAQLDRAVGRYSYGQAAPGYSTPPAPVGTR